MSDAPLLEIDGLTKRFTRGSTVVTALDRVALTIGAGETLAVVGPSGSGKSTLARVMMRLLEPDEGRIRLGGKDLLSLTGGALRQERRCFQMVFQDPIAAFNPRATVSRLIEEPLRIHRIVPRAERSQAVDASLEDVGLSPDLRSRLVHELSGGQRQRVAIARALATRPELLVLDEPLSALDVAVRAGIVELLRGLQRTRGIAYLFIAHDLALVHAFADRVAIMDAGRIVETGLSRDVIANPASSMGKALVAASPRLPPRLEDKQ